MMNTPRIKTISMAEIMTPDMANFTGNIHGGHLMKFFDKTAYACAVQYASLPMVTLSVDHIFFKAPIHIGDLVICLATVNYVGSTSMEVGIHVDAEDLMTREKRHTNSCYFTMVALDKNGKTTAIPPLTLNNETEKKRFKEAERRREARKLYYQQHHGK